MTSEGLRPGRLLRVRQVAEALNVSTMTVYRLVQAGELRATRVGSSWRVFEDAVDEYLARGAREAAGSRAGAPGRAGAQRAASDGSHAARPDADGAGRARPGGTRPRGRR